jgi:phosphonopyruvate decarboxylase
MQPSHTKAGLDLVAVARACRFRQARAVSRLEEADDIRALLHADEGPVFASARVQPEEAPRVLPLRDGHAIKQRFMDAMAASGPT